MTPGQASSLSLQVQYAVLGARQPSTPHRSLGSQKETAPDVVRPLLWSYRLRPRFLPAEAV